MKKLLSLLMLALVSIGTAWAEDEVLFSANPTAAWSVPASTTEAEITSDYATITGGKMFVTNKQSAAKDLIKKQGGEFAFQQTNNDTFFKVVLNKVLEAGDIISARMQSRTDTDLGLFMSTAISRPNECSTAINLATAASQEWVVAPTYTVAEGDGICGETTFYIYRATGKSTYFNTLTITRPVAASDPQFTIASTASIKATESGVTATTDIAVVGANLTGSTVTATLASPVVPGLSVDLASSTIVDGAISTTATLSYTATENASGTTTLTISDGTTSKDITISYKAKVVYTELQSISEATTWDFSNDVTGSVQFTTDEDKNKEFVYTDIDELTFAETFNSSALAFKGEYPFRANDKKFAQNGTLRFNTTVPGTIVVKFSDTGSSANADAVKRYLVVNGEQTEYWTSRENNGDEPYAAQLNVTTGEIAVAAGDVTIAGTSAITVSSVTFTPAPEPTYATLTVPETITDGEYYYTTFSSDKALDFSGVEGIEAFVIKKKLDSYSEYIENCIATLVTTVPANTGLLIRATVATSYIIPFAEGEVAVVDNDLVIASEDIDLYEAITEKWNEFATGPAVLKIESVVNWNTFNYEDALGFFPTTKPAAAGTDILPAGTVYLPLTAEDGADNYGANFTIKFPAGAVDVATAANIAELKALTESSTVELTLTNAQITYSKYDGYNNQDFFVLSDASGAVQINGVQGISEYLSAGMILNGKTTLQVEVDDYSVYDMGIIRQYKLTEEAASDLAYATMGYGQNVSISEGTATPTVITEENISDYAADYDWRYVTFEGVTLGVSAGTYGDDNYFSHDDLGDIFISNVFDNPLQVPAEGTLINITGFMADLYGQTVFVPTTLETITLAVTVGTAGYATFSSDKALDFSASTIKAYVATVSGEDITFTRVDQVPANTGVLLYAEGGATEDIPVIATADAVNDNAFVVATAAMNGAALQAAGAYILAAGAEGIGFYKAGSGASLAAGKAYLVASTDARIVMPNGEVTGISAIDAAQTDAPAYNLNGQRVEKAKKGLYIVGGKKVVVK